MQIAPAQFIAALFDNKEDAAALGVITRALFAVLGESANSASTEVNWDGVCAAAFEILEREDAEAAKARADAAAGTFELADLFKPASIMDRAHLNAEVVAGLKKIGRALNVPIL